MSWLLSSSLCIYLINHMPFSILESHILCSLLPIRFPIHTDLFPIPPKTFGVCFVFDNYVDKTLLKLFNPECNSFEHCHISFVANVCITASCDFSFKLFKIWENSHESCASSLPLIYHLLLRIFSHMMLPFVSFHMYLHILPPLHISSLFTNNFLFMIFPNTRLDSSTMTPSSHTSTEKRAPNTKWSSLRIWGTKILLGI